MGGEKDLQYWKELWESHGQNDRDQQEFWDNRAEFFNEKVFNVDKLESYVVELLQSQKMLSKNMDVLDIGSGPGKHTLPLAREVKRVTALDISDKMLEFLKENMEYTNIHNIEPVKGDWEKMDLKERKWEKVYDLVLASMTPGISSYETLEKLLRASKKYCYLSSFVKRQDLIGDEIRAYIYEKYNLTSNKADKLYYAFNILWQLGYTPEVRYINRNWEDEFSMDEAYSLYRDKMISLTDVSDKDLLKIQEILERNSDNGMITEKTEVTQGILTWEM